MNKKIIITISIGAFLLGVFLWWNVGIKFFFNDFLYETPNLKGLTLEEANSVVGSDFKLVNMGESYSKLKKGEIFAQLPLPPKHIKKSRPIKIWISKGSDVVTIPDLKGMTLQEAKLTLNNLGLKIDRVSHTTEGKLNNRIIGTSPQIGSSISRDTPISLLVNVSKIKNVRMPDILGYSLLEGEQILRKKNLVVGEIKKVYRTDFPDDTIIDVNYLAGKSILAGTIVNITVSTHEEEE